MNCLHWQPVTFWRYVSFKHVMVVMVICRAVHTAVDEPSVVLVLSRQQPTVADVAVHSHPPGAAPVTHGS